MTTTLGIVHGAATAPQCCWWAHVRQRGWTPTQSSSAALSPSSGTRPETHSMDTKNITHGWLASRQPSRRATFGRVSWPHRPLSSWPETERKRQLQFPMLQVRREKPQERKGREARDHSVDTKETIFRKRMTMVTSPTTERGLRCAGATIPTDAGQQRRKANARIAEHTSAGFAWGHIRP